MTTGTPIKYGETFYLTTTKDSPIADAGITTCRTQKAEPFNLLWLTPDTSIGLALKFVSAHNALATGNVQRDHEVYLALANEHERSGEFKTSGKTSNGFKFKCGGNYVTVDTGEDADDRTRKMSNAILNIRDIQDRSSSANITYGSVNYVTGTAGGTTRNYFSFCDDIINSAAGCKGPAIAWRSSDSGNRLKFIIHRFPTECVNLGELCTDEGSPCCGNGQGRDENSEAEFINCLGGHCLYCNSNGMPCDPQDGSPDGIQCCSGLCQGGTCVARLDLGDSCTGDNECGVEEDAWVCLDDVCEKCIPDANYYGPGKCTCFGRGTVCEEDVDCCGILECQFNNSTQTYLCADFVKKQIPWYAWLLIIALACVLILVVVYLMRVNAAGQAHLKKQQKDTKLMMKIAAEEAAPPPAPGAPGAPVAVGPIAKKLKTA